MTEVKKKKFFTIKKIIIIFLLFAFTKGCIDTLQEDGANNDISLESLVNNSAKFENIDPKGEISKIFELNSEYTDLQRENKLKEITGKYVKWSLPVYEVSKEGEHYSIQTMGSAESLDDIMDNAMDGIETTDYVSTFIEIYPQSENDHKILAGLKTGDYINFKGKILDVTARSLNIEPAILNHDN